MKEELRIGMRSQVRWMNQAGGSALRIAALPSTFKREAMIQSARIRGVLALEKLEG
jgi:hypothetical protein